MEAAIGQSASRQGHLLPLVIASAFFFMADIDSPRWGVIRVAPANLIDLAQVLRGP